MTTEEFMHRVEVLCDIIEMSSGLDGDHPNLVAKRERMDARRMELMQEIKEAWEEANKPK